MAEQAFKVSSRRGRPALGKKASSGLRYREQKLVRLAAHYRIPTRSPLDHSELLASH